MNIAAAKETAKPISDMHSSAGYRKAMVRVLAWRVIEAVMSGMLGV